jgi:AAA family ATP:ADP antiporter
MLSRIAALLWGKFDSSAELRKFLTLAGIFFLVIGTYWTLRPIKDSIFMSVVGKDLLWGAKLVSLLAVGPLVMLYSKLLDIFHRHYVFYILVFAYAIAAFLFAWGFSHPEIGLANTVPSGSRMIGWAWYVFVESFGSLVVALFWGITTDVTAPESAKRGFPLIVLFGQLGNICGPLFLNVKYMGFANSAPIIGICGVLMILSGIGMWIFRATTSEDQLQGYQDKAHSGEEEPEPGFLDGLKLMVTRKYLFGIFGIIFFFEMIVTILDYHFKITVGQTFADEASRSATLSEYAWKTGVVATLCVLLGINNIQRKLGMVASLLLLPVLVGLAILTMKFNPMSLTIAMWLMILSKAVNYALNGPTMKQLYIPTTPESKYKAQAWIETFGSRASKGAASVVNKFRADLALSTFLTMSAVISFGLIGVWVMVALYVAKSYNKAIKDKNVVC